MKLKKNDILFATRMGHEIDSFISSTGRDAWQRLIDKVERIPGRFYKDLFISKNPLVRPLKAYLELYQTGKSIWKHRSSEIESLAVYSYTINRILYNINPTGKRQVISRLLADDNLPLLHEINIATHFLVNGFNVEFVEYERDVNNSGRTFDFLVSNNSVNAEVECKHKSYDAGRKITRAGFYMLCDELLKQFSGTPIKCLISVKCKKRLDANQNVFIDLARKVLSAINSRQPHLIIDEDIEIYFEYLPDDMQVTSKEQAQAVAAKHLSQATHLATVSGKEMTFIITVQSAKKEEVIQSIYDELKKSLDQFTKTKPALITCYIEGIYPEDWQELQGENGLAYMTTHLLRKDEARHVYSIAYSSMEEAIRTEHITQTNHPALLFRNETCIFPESDDMFRLKEGVTNFEPRDWIRT